MRTYVAIFSNVNLGGRLKDTNTKLTLSPKIWLSEATKDPSKAIPPPPPIGTSEPKYF